MLERLKTLLDGLATPAQIDCIVDACETLSAHGYQDHWFSIEQIFTSAVDDPTGLVHTIINEQLCPLYRGLLASMGITLAPDVTLAQSVEVFRGVMQIENFDDNATLYGLATCDESAEDIFLSLLEVVTAQQSEYFAPFIDGVTDSFIRVVAKITSNFVDTVPIDQVYYNRAKSRVQRLLEYCQTTQPTLLETPIDLSTLRLGYPLESLLQDKRDMIEDLPVQQASLLLLLYIYCSEVPDDVLDAVVSRELELTFSNVVTAMDAARRITVLRGVEREQT